MRAIVVFVEGQGDAAYVLRSLGQVVGAEFDKREPEALPTPFGKSPGQGGQSQLGMVLSWNKRAATNQTMASSAEDHEPVFQAAASVPSDHNEPGRPNLVFLVRMGGDRKALVVQKLLDQLRISFTSGLNHDITRLACAFVFDADTPGHYQESTGDCVQFREQRFAADYAKDLENAALEHNGWTTGQAIPLGLFVLHASATRSGTLEHLVEPALHTDLVWKPRLQGAEEFLLAHEQLADPVFVKDSAERSKARITMAGQWSDPGSSLAQILRRGDPQKAPSVPDSVFASSDARSLVKFLMSVPW